MKLNNVVLNCKLAEKVFPHRSSKRSLFIKHPISFHPEMSIKLFYSTPDVDESEVKYESLFKPHALVKIVMPHCNLISNTLPVNVDRGL